jgi:STE24 endopeptidase
VGIAVGPLNAWGVVILAGLVLELAVGLAADVLGLRALRPEPPAELRDLYDAERWRRGLAYTRARSRFGALVSTLDLGLLVAFWLAGGFAALDRAVRSLGLGPVPSGLVFLGALGLGRALVSLPFGWWSTFRIEERFGFNRTTPRTFWADVAKGLALTILLGGPLLAAVLWIFATAGARAWLWCWLGGAAVLLALQVVVPRWIMPLFNRFTPLDDGALRDSILDYARTVGFPLEGVFVVDGSRRSSKGNAFFIGVGRHKRVALFDTLVERLRPAELVAVLAHEIGHYRRHHVVVGTAVTVLRLGVTLLLFSVAIEQPGLFAAFFVAEPSVHAGMVFFALLATPFEALVSVALLTLSRRHEREADAFAVATTGDGAALASALRALAADSLSNPTPHRLQVLLEHSHPPVLARIRALAPAVGRASPPGAD